MNPLLLVAAGGVAGTLVRFGLSVVIPDDRTGTLAANLLGVAHARAL
jgi:CrcB protein